jgi:hypothetical protein
MRRKKSEEDFDYPCGLPRDALAPNKSTEKYE